MPISIITIQCSEEIETCPIQPPQLLSLLQNCQYIKAGPLSHLLPLVKSSLSSFYFSSYRRNENDPQNDQTCGRNNSWRDDFKIPQEHISKNEAVQGTKTGERRDDHDI